MKNRIDQIKSIPETEIENPELKELAKEEVKMVEDILGPTARQAGKDRSRLKRLARAGALAWAFTLAGSMAERATSTSEARGLPQSEAVSATSENKQDKPIYHIDESAAERSGLKRIIFDYDNINAVVIGKGGALKFLNLKEIWKEKGIKPIYIEGDRITISMGVSTNFRSEYFVFSEVYPETYRSYTDEYMNFVSENFIRADVNTVNIERSVILPIAIPISGEEYVSMSVPINSIEVSDLIFVKSAEEVDGSLEKAGHPYYMRGIGLETKRMIMKNAESFSSGIRDVERVFGLSDNPVVRAVYVDGQYFDEKNAFVYPLRKDVVSVTEDFITSPDTTKDMLESVGRHEALHSVDLTNGISVDERAWQIYHMFSNDERGSLFFQGVNEEMFKLGSFGGHSEDNELEFFASFMNSMLWGSDPEWKKNLLGHHTEFIKTYKEAIDVMRCVLLDASWIKPDAPIFRKIDERMQIVDQVLAEKLETK